MRVQFDPLRACDPPRHAHWQDYGCVTPPVVPIETAWDLLVCKFPLKRGPDYACFDFAPIMELHE